MKCSIDSNSCRYSNSLLSKPKEVFHDSIIQAVAFPTHTLLNSFLTKHTLVLFMLVLPTLVGMED